MANIKEARKKVEKKIYETFNILDPTGQNTEFYKHKFAKMSDTEFYTFFKQDFPLKFQTKIFEIELLSSDTLNTLSTIAILGIIVAAIITQGKGAIENVNRLSIMSADVDNNKKADK